MRIRLTPYDYDYLKVHWRIDGDNYYFFASCVMGSQFSAFLSAVYNLYEEEANHIIYIVNTIRIRISTSGTRCRLGNDPVYCWPCK